MFYCQKLVGTLSGHTRCTIDFLLVGTLLVGTLFFLLVGTEFFLLVGTWENLVGTPGKLVGTSEHLVSTPGNFGHWGSFGVAWGPFGAPLRPSGRCHFEGCSK